MIPASGCGWRCPAAPACYYCLPRAKLGTNLIVRAVIQFKRFEIKLALTFNLLYPWYTAARMIVPVVLPNHVFGAQRMVARIGLLLLFGSLLTHIVLVPAHDVATFAAVSVQSADNSVSLAYNDHGPTQLPNAPSSLPHLHLLNHDHSHHFVHVAMIAATPALLIIFLADPSWWKLPQITVVPPSPPPRAVFS